ncbi:MAG: hypothetical protein OQK82_04275, partial [Candidatus Pacearchaeota archaeon]|nr:hypothetical protein [Candidatus Pacearchaeota archaeon]
LSPLADSTGGYFFYARNAAELTELYSEIRTDNESRVVIRYVTPDTLFDGDTHTITCATDLSGTVVKDTAYWNEDNRAPTITLTQSTIDAINTEQSSGEALAISAYITDDDIDIPVRTLLYQIASEVSPQIPVEMQLVADSEYVGIIPAEDAKKPGITFYITAADSHNARTTVGPYRINMDNSGPLITHTPPEHLYAGEDLTLILTAEDSDSVTLVVIYYRNALTTVFTRDTLIFVDNDTFDITINGGDINSAWFEYYFEAEDSFDALSRNPVSSTYRIMLNQQPQIIFEGPAIVYEGDTFSVTVTAFDPENELTSFSVESTLPDGCEMEPFADDRIQITWKTGSSDIGEHRIIFSTSDGNYTITDTLILTVKDINYPPSITVPDDITATEGDSIGFIITGYDPDGAVLRFESFNLPPGATFLDHGDNSVTVTWKTGSLDAGVHILTFTATDGETTVRDTMRISIADFSFSPPEIFATTHDTIIPSGQQITIIIWATDADNIPPTLQFKGVPHTATVTKNSIGDSAVFTWTADEDQANITAVAFDKINSDHSDTLHIAITVGLFYTTAAMLDTNGNGIFDRIDFTWCEEAVLSDELPQPGKWIDSIIITPENGSGYALEPLTMHRDNDKQLSVVLRESTHLNTGFSDVSIHLTRLPVTTEALPSLVDTVKDKTGPVLKKAV